MTNAVVCFTSFTWSYLPRARVLAATLRETHPNWCLWAVLVDQPPPGAPAHRLLSAFDRVLTIADLGIPRWRSWMFKHSRVEACCAVKGAALRAVLAHGPAWAVYLDPDIAVFHALSVLRDASPDQSVLLTPHQTRPSPSARARADGEAGSLRHGVYNLGFLAVRNDRNGHGFATWWDACLQEACYEEPEAGLFVDQKYCDLAPGLFAGVAVLRHSACNVASWNLAARDLRVTSRGALLVDGLPLQFYHFSKLGAAGDVMTDRYAPPGSPARELWAWYRRAVSGQPAVADAWYYGQYGDGRPITRAARILYRRRPDLMTAFDDPYDPGPAGLRAWLLREAPEALRPD